jgi:hypothetical protein
MNRTICIVCKTATAATGSTACEGCLMAALGAYGWTNGRANAAGELQRGEPDPDAHAELDRRIKLGRGKA